MADKYCTECGVSQPHEEVQGKETCMVCGHDAGKTAPAKEKRRNGRMPTPNKLSETDKADIIRLVAGGKAIAVLAEDFHVSTQTIRNVVNKGKKDAKGAPEPAEAKKRGRRANKNAPTRSAGGLRGCIEAVAKAAVKDEIEALREEVRELEESLPKKLRELVVGELN